MERLLVFLGIWGAMWLLQKLAEGASARADGDPRPAKRPRARSGDPRAPRPPTLEQWLENLQEQASGQLPIEHEGPQINPAPGSSERPAVAVPLGRSYPQLEVEYEGAEATSAPSPAPVPGGRARLIKRHVSSNIGEDRDLSAIDESTLPDHVGRRQLGGLRGHLEQRARAPAVPARDTARPAAGLPAGLGQLNELQRAFVLGEVLFKSPAFEHDKGLRF